MEIVVSLFVRSCNGKNLGNNEPGINWNSNRDTCPPPLFQISRLFNIRVSVAFVLHASIANFAFTGSQKTLKPDTMYHDVNAK